MQLWQARGKGSEDGLMVDQGIMVDLSHTSTAGETSVDVIFMPD